MTAPHLVQLLRPRLVGQRNRWLRSSGAEQGTTVFLAFLGAVFWVGLFLLFGWLIDSFYSVEVFGPIITRKLLELLMVGLFVLLCFSNVVAALSTFYLSDDLELLLSLPVSRESFHFARLADTITQSSWMLLFFGVPIFAAYGYAYGAGPVYVLSVCAVLPGFVVIPAGLGVLISTILVTVFPARRVREALALVGILVLVAGFIVLRAVRPERLVDADSFESVAAYVAELQAPIPALAPPGWVSEILVSALMGKPYAWMELALLCTGAVAMSAVARWVTARFYDQGRARAQEARTARLAKSGLLDRVLSVWVAPLPKVMRALVIKDVKTFFRDAAQWSQVFVVGSIVTIAIVSVAAMPMDMFRGQYAQAWRNMFGFAAHALVGFVMAAVAARFLFTSVSSEGRAFWILRTAPLLPEQLLWAKMWPYLPALILVGEAMAIGSTLILESSLFLTVVSAVTAVFLAVAIAGIAVGMGAVFPDFKADNAARVAAGPAGVMFMIVSLSLVFLVVALEAVPTVVYLGAEFDNRALTARDWALVVVPLLAAAGVCVGATVLSIRVGARRLWDRELPNS